MHRLPLIGGFLIVFVMGATLSYFAHDFVSGIFVRDSNSNDALSFGKEVRQGGFSFINPLLECEVADELIRTEVGSFRDKLNDLIAGYKESGKVKEVAVYYRDMNNGPWYGINERSKFTPASLLKTPLLIAYYKQAEIKPEILDEEISYDGTSDAVATNTPLATQVILPEKNLVPGIVYSVSELLRRMIVYSDNEAMRVLWSHIDPQMREQVYKDLGIPLPTVDTPENYMTVKEYAGFFRILYNASYLNPTYSEKALELLSQVAYKDGLVAGVPGNIPIAHKFGERSYEGKPGGATS